MKKTRGKKISSSKLKDNITLRKTRVRIPIKLRRELLVDCGHRCTIHSCAEIQNLEAHHINGIPSDNRPENIIMLCPNHHTLADRGTIDKEACRMYKNRLGNNPVTAVQILESINSLKDHIDQLKPKHTRKNKRRKTK